jgi:tetratricopeptide (TPR) repeat protein
MTDSLKNWRVTGFIATLVIVLSFPAYLLKEDFARARAVYEPEPMAEFVGRDKCVECHKEAYEKWQGSHHDLAMDIATEETVLGDFDDSMFSHKGVTSRFTRRDGKFFVHTEGPDGEMGEFEITHTFGAWPLQQYLVPFPGGRLQALSIAWDVEEKRWFHLYPDNTPPPGDWLHWTRNAQNWNGMCAECHSTDLRKNYDPESDTYGTTWSEIDVSCEACHGPGSLHVLWAEIDPMARPESNDLELVVQTGELESKQMVELCAPCHSRRTILGDYDHAQTEQLDTFLPELLTDGTYFADGQIQDEVYVYGSFVQSKMYRMGVRCNDCHDVHSLKPMHEGNELCLQCHRADTYNTADHHFHKEFYQDKPSDGWLCISCHMPQRPYMVIDYRADHSIRVPRPDLNLSVGTPDACSMVGCHDDKPVQWSADWYTTWYGLSRKPQFGTVISAGRRGEPGALEGLIQITEDRLYPAIVRATALSLLRNYPPDAAIPIIKRALVDEEPLVRHTGIVRSEGLSAEERVELIAPLLWDPVRAVRIEAARSLAGIDSESLKPDQRKRLPEVLGEYEDAMAYSLDFSFAGFNLGNLYSNMDNPEEAEKYYLEAIRIDDLFYPAKVNLAMLYNRGGKNREAEKLLRDALEINAELFEVAYSLGLLYAEMNRTVEAAAYLKKASEGMPGYPRVHYNLGLLLQAAGKDGEAETALRKALNLAPDNPDYFYALADFFIKRGMIREAAFLAEETLARFPDHTVARQVIEYLERQ